jgi:Cd2+/Zn2+-exporting ATPase
MAKYTIRGLDCASCASEIECELKRTPGLEDARLSFAAGALYIDEAQEENARSIIERLEPGVTIEAAESAAGPAHEEAESLGKGELVRIGVATALLAVGIIFNQALHDTPFSIAEYAVMLAAYALVGGSVLASAAKSIARGQVFNEMFLMSVATLGAMAIHQLPEAVAVMLFYSVGEYFQDRAVDKSRRSISELMDLRPDSARVIVDGQSRVISPEEARVGDILEVLPGERIPLDGAVVEGSSFVNTSSLTGESVPRRVASGDAVLGGFVNDEGRILVRVEKEYREGAASRILELVENASTQKAPTEKFITRFAAVYTPIVVAAAALIAFAPPLLVPGARLEDWVYRALVMLVISCPCALVVSIPLGYFGGIGGASRNKLLIKGGNYIDALAKVDTVVFDKTGTLTEGVFSVVKVETRNGFTKKELLDWAAAAESSSSHPIARSIKEAAGAEASKASDIVEVKGHGVIAKVEGRVVAIGNDRLMHRERIEHSDCDAEGTVAFVAVDGVYAGHIVISDKVKAEAAKTVAELKALGVRRVAMLTGDDKAVAAKVAEELGLDEYYAELLPDGKVAELERLEHDPERRGALVFVGDGMNDAPVLVRSDVGFAMGGLGSDAAIEAADVVVMDDFIGRVPLAIRISRFTRRIIVENIAMALIVKTAFLSLGALGLANMWEAVIGDVGVSILAVLNSIRSAGYARSGKEAT